jgi:TRAP-type C4-dicarboxylate transport system permease small subunit
MRLEAFRQGYERALEWVVIARIVAEALVIAFFVLTGWVGWTVLGVLATDHLVSLPDVPVSWVQSVVPISCALIVFAEILNLPRVIADARSDTGISGGASH